jgi:hypothetical protein
VSFPGLAQGPDVLVRCPLCGAYDFAPADCALCIDCAVKVSRARAREEARGGRVLVVGNEARVYSAEHLATPEGAIAYAIDAHEVMRGPHEPVAHRGEA